MSSHARPLLVDSPDDARYEEVRAFHRARSGGAATAGDDEEGGEAKEGGEGDAAP